MKKSRSLAKSSFFMLMASCLMSSMLPAKLYMSVAIMSIFLILVNNKKPSIPRLWIIWSNIYLIAIGLNCIYSEYQNISWAFFRGTVTHILIATFFIWPIKSKADFMNALKAYVYIGVLSALIVLFKERSTILYSPLGTDTFGGNIPFTYILIPATVACIFLIMNTINKYKRMLYIVLAVFLLVVSLLTTSRKAIFLPILFYIIFTFFHFKKSFKKTLGYILFGGIIVAIVFIVFMHHGELSDFAFRRITSFISYSVEGEGDESLAIREVLIQKGLTFISERPIFGYGMGTYSYLTGNVVYSHNNYIETLFGGGIVMLIIYYSMYLICIYKLWKRSDSVSHFLIAMCIVYLISDFGTVSYFIYPQLFLLTMATAVSEKSLCL